MAEDSLKKLKKLSPALIVVGWKVYCRHVFDVCSWGQAKSSPLLAVDANNPLLMKVA